MKATKKNFKQFITNDAIFTAFVTVFFLIMFIQTFGIEETSDIEETSSGILPSLLCVTGFIIGVTILILKFTKPSDEPKDRAPKNVIQEGKNIHVVYTVLFTAGYFFVMPFLGFILTNVIATVAFSFFMGFKRKIMSSIVAISVAVALYILFSTLLKVRLPQGIIESLLPF